ncbi:hypothetical protein OQJ19_09860 [Fluoribacter gormanii]|uniref:hypothetical protein n=1 Tax=Fluoribacter gormanii TaxID=464 RepID=UPI0022438B4E|nr:hypothetical protein [Fluoribacter gormanii]MCW8470948.1 hypothetical protein [Fluoribacter gormanii]
MKILYIPFSIEDALFDLQRKANIWYERSKKKNADVFIVYHDSGKVAQQEKIQQALQNGEGYIYILSHGMDTSKFMVCNQSIDDDTYQELTIEKVAEHFIKDLVISNFSDKNIVKLFFCDECRLENKSRSMAEQFRKQLGESLQKIEIEYYSEVSLSVPGVEEHSLFGGAKGALKTLRMSNDIFDFNLTCLVGKAKTFRHGLNEKSSISALSSSVSSARFFDSRVQQEKVKYPKYSHPILKNLAEKLVKLIQSDKLLSKNQEHIIDELLAFLPRDIKSYKESSIKFTGKSIKLEFTINKAILALYLNKLGITTEESETLESVRK